MNKSESKYFNTALLMDEALISLLEKKDFEYITVKEICKTAGVSRSTFYLHYETLSDLANEAMEVVNKRFQSYFSQKEEELTKSIDDLNLKDLVFINEYYLKPYLLFISENKKVYRAAFKNPDAMQSHKRYKYFKRYIIEPILTRFSIPQEHHKYYIAYYIEGIMAIVREWLDNNCVDSVESIADIIEKCVRLDFKIEELQELGFEKR